MSKVFTFFCITIVLILMTGIYVGIYSIGKDSQYLVGQLTNTQVEIKTIRPLITDIYQYNMMDEMGANPESTQSIRERYLETPFVIHENPGHNEVLVYLPALFSLSNSELDAFSKRLRTLKDYKLDINIFTYSNFDVTLIQKFYNHLQPDFSSITWRFYDIPSNYYELFRHFRLNLAHKDMTIEFYGKMFPDGFMMSAFIDNVRDMLNKILNPGDTLDSISFVFEEIGDVFFMLPMAQSGAMTIQSLPTKSLYSDRIIIDTRPGGPGETLSGRKKIEKFFRESTIEQILLNGVGEKNGNEIMLYNF